MGDFSQFGHIFKKEMHRAVLQDKKPLLFWQDVFNNWPEA